jgi:hypothetical protein
VPHDHLGSVEIVRQADRPGPIWSGAVALRPPRSRRPASKRTNRSGLGPTGALSRAASDPRGGRGTPFIAGAPVRSGVLGHASLVGDVGPSGRPP